MLKVVVHKVGQLLKLVDVGAGGDMVAAGHPQKQGPPLKFTVSTVYRCLYFLTNHVGCK